MANCIELQIEKGRFYLFVLAFFLALYVFFFFVSRCKSVFISIPQFNISHCFFNATCRYIIKFFVELTTIHIHFAEFFWKVISSREITTVSPGVLSIWGGNCSANNRICTFSAWFHPLCLVFIFGYFECVRSCYGYYDCCYCYASVRSQYICHFRLIRMLECWTLWNLFILFLIWMNFGLNACCILVCERAHVSVL